MVAITMWHCGRMVAALTLVGGLLAGLVVGPGRAQAGPAMAQQGVGCSWAPVRSAPEAPTLIAEVTDDDEGEEEEAEARIVGSLPAPPNTRRDDQRALGAVATITRDQAVQIAFGALPDADRRRVEDVELEIEQGYVIWEVETVLRGSERSPDRYAEVVVDAGNGNILAVGCEAEDD